MRQRQLSAVGTVGLALLEARAQADDPDITRGAATYKELCARCHGSSAAMILLEACEMTAQQYILV